MALDCARCGLWSDVEEIRDAGPYRVCRHCGHAERFLRLPLFAITGASGTGKTALGRALGAALAECVVLDRDILWRSGLKNANDKYRMLNETWLDLAFAVGQAGRPVVLYGTTLPEQIEPLPARRYFSAVHYLALISDDDALLRRLVARPAWRGASDAAFVQRMREFNRWIRENAARTEPALTLLDTPEGSIDDCVVFSARWVRERL